VVQYSQKEVVVVYDDIVIKEIVNFYKANDFDFDIAVNFQYLYNTTGLTNDTLDEILRSFNDNGFLKDVCWADYIAFEFYLSKLGKKKFGLI
jgi:hypothetical protein